MKNELLALIIQNSALKMGCEKALALLEDGDAEPSDADNVIRILKSVLEIKKYE